MPNEIEDLQEQVDFLFAQVNSLKINTLQSNSGYGSVAMSQGVTTATTLSAAITSITQTTITVAAAINILNTTYMLIDDEIVQVTAGGTTTSLTIVRGLFGTVPALHANGAIVDNSLNPFGYLNPLNHVPLKIAMNASFVTGTSTIGISNGIYEAPKPTTANKSRQIFEFAILDPGSSSAPAYNGITTLSAAITSTTATTISVTSGTNIANGQYIQVGNQPPQGTVGTIHSEIMRVLSGGGTTTLTVQRQALELPLLPAVTQLNGATVWLLPYGYVSYFMLGGNGFRAWITATPQNIYVFFTQIGSGFANTTLNFTLDTLG